MKKLLSFLVLSVLLAVSINCYSTTYGNEQILVCPFCQGEKSVLRLNSGNTINGRQWSDLRTDYPMLPLPSKVQKCPHCGKYYFLNSVEKKMGESHSYERGELSYTEIKEAVKQYANTSLTKDEEICLRLLFIHRYNDTYQREYSSVKTFTIFGRTYGINFQPDTCSKVIVLSREEEKLFKGQVIRLLQIWDEAEPILRAEFYREIGDFEKCLEILDTIEPEDDFNKEIAKKIRKYAKRKNKKAFIIES